LPVNGHCKNLTRHGSDGSGTTFFALVTPSPRRAAELRRPNYLRDNIRVDLLALAYADFVKRMVTTGRSDRFGPMSYVETQGAFTERYAQAMRPRLGLDSANRE